MKPRAIIFYTISCFYLVFNIPTQAQVRMNQSIPHSVIIDKTTNNLKNISDCIQSSKLSVFIHPGIDYEKAKQTILSMKNDYDSDFPKGLFEPVDIDVLKLGIWENLRDGGRICRFKLMLKMLRR